MRVSILFSGGKDSSLAAILLEPFFDVELVTCSFSLLPVGDIGREVAEKLGFAHRVLRLDVMVLEQAYALLLQDRYPRSAINHIHQAAIESLASERGVKLIADGVRRDDRVPVLEMSRIRSIEDRYGVSYMSPLKGFGYGAIHEMVNKHLRIEEDLSDNVIKADYETELRELVRRRGGEQMVSELFPRHTQSHVVERIASKGAGLVRA